MFIASMAAPVCAAEEMYAPNRFSDNYSETIVLDGKSYTYIYSFDENGNKTVNIVENNSGKVEKLTYDESEGKFYLEGNVVATVCDTGEPILSREVDLRSGDTGWLYVCSGSRTITWEIGVAQAVLLAAIGIVLEGVALSAILVTVGNTALNALKDYYSGAVIEYDLYDRIINYEDYMKYVWTIKVSTGRFGGPYNTVIAV